MSMTTSQYAALANDVYKKPPETGERSKPVDIGGVSYKRLSYMDSASGYQGILYQRLDTKELIVAHRGSEFDRQPWRDGLVADGGMVATRHNAQAADAIEFTRHALETAKQIGQYTNAHDVTVVGHSLGGGLAEITAHHFGLKGETFNGYGAVSLDRRIPEGGNAVINHVMAGDPVSAASRHYGQVRVYATEQEIAALERTGYDDQGSGLRNPISAAKGLVTDSHTIYNFLPTDKEGRPKHSVLEDATAQHLAQRHAPMIERYRDDIATLRMGVTLGARGWGGLLQDGVAELRGPLAPGAGRESIGVPNWSEHMQRLQMPRMESGEPQGWRAPQKVPEQSSVTPAEQPADPLYQMLKSRLPAGIADAAVSYAASQARREGMERPEQITAVTLLEGGSAWIEGSTPGYRVKVDLSGTPPLVQERRTDQAPEPQHLAQQLDAPQQQASVKGR
ncbi:MULTISPECIES: hypothetical protein [Xanthomonas]|uniref:hypothetical protein n=1 Tax=Xanthomonas TaxID=338 RepID=UPI0022571D94|nr:MULTISPECIES: hypothetical protein [Xanthomonas]MCW0392237.1 hypothetical protein [Xanthomonas sacchari]MDY4283116.1 hypothetical protein [Xanthomonas sp. LF06-19]